MSQDFLRSLDLDDSIYSNDNVLVVEQSGNSDGSYVLHYLLSDFVKRFGGQKGHVLLVLTRESMSHWNAISAKLGWNLATAQAKGSVKLLDLTQQVYRRLRNKSASQSQVLDEATILSVEGIQSWLLDRITEINAKMSSSTFSEGENSGNKSSARVLVVIDDLTSVFHNVVNKGISREKSVVNLVRNVLAMEDSDPLKCAEICVATLVTSAGGLFASTVSHCLSSVSFQVSPLQTGFSQLFHGYFTVTRRPVNVNDKKRVRKSYQYKVEDRQVQFSPLTKYNF